MLYNFNQIIFVNNKKQQLLHRICIKDIHLFTVMLLTETSAVQHMSYTSDEHEMCCTHEAMVFAGLIENIHFCERKY